MDLFQSILVYLTLAVAIVYIAKKFILPKRLFVSKRNAAKHCGEHDCGCH